MNQLRHVAEFRSVLDNYRLSETAAKTLAAVRLVLLVAPTASGRNTIIEELLKSGDYYFIVSDTTRLPRVNNGIPEKTGREYWFRDEEAILGELRKGEFLEAAIIHNQQVSGISIRELEKARAKRKIAITDIEVAGAATIHEAKPDSLICFMVPPSFEIWLERIHKRGNMPADELQRRFTSAAKEFEAAFEDEYYRFVLNDTIAGTTAEMHDLVTTGRYDPLKEKFARETAETLYHDISAYLAGIA